MNAQLRQIAGPIADESDLVSAFRNRIDELNIARAEIDAELNLPGGYTSKRLTLPQVKYFGRDAFWNIAELLGLAVILVEDPAATKRYAARMKRRSKPQAVTGAAHWRTRAMVMRIPWLITKERAREIGSIGGRARVAKQSLRMRSKSARRAALIRWKGKGCSMKTGKLTHMTMNEFRDACVRLRPGETFIYAIGFASLTRHISESRDEPTIKEVDGVRRMAMEASDRGEVYLTQKKLAIDLYEYRATKALPKAVDKPAVKRIAA